MFLGTFSVQTQVSEVCTQIKGVQLDECHKPKPLFVPSTQIGVTGLRCPFLGYGNAPLMLTPWISFACS